MISGEFVQFLERFSDGDGICERNGSLMVREGLILMTKSQVDETTSKQICCLGPRRKAVDLQRCLSMLKCSLQIHSSVSRREL